MFIPPKKHPKPDPNSDFLGKVSLSSMHIILGKQILENWKEEVNNVFFAYYPERTQLLVAPVSHAFFAKLHDSGQLLLKAKNLLGDKSMALHEILIDHDIDPTDRELKFEFMGKHGILKIYI